MIPNGESVAVPNVGIKIIERIALIPTVAKMETSDAGKYFKSYVT